MDRPKVQERAAQGASERRSPCVAVIGVNIEVIPEVRGNNRFVSASQSSSERWCLPPARRNNIAKAQAIEENYRPFHRNADSTDGEELHNQIGQLKVGLATNNLVYTSFRYYIP
jgi:hypothetical protein